MHQDQGPGNGQKPENETDSVQGRLSCALESYRAGRLDEAERLYGEILEDDPDNPDALHLLGVTVGRDGNFEDAESLIARAIHVNPSIATYHNSHGIILRLREKTQEALAAFDRAVMIDPDLAEAHFNRGSLLRAQGHLKGALAAYEKVVRIDPDSARAHFYRGGILRQQGQTDNAMAAYDEALRIKPDFAEAHYNRGIVLQVQGVLKEALLAYEEAVRCKPDYADAHNNRGAVLKILGRNEEALAAFDQVISIDPTFAGAHNNSGLILHEFGRLEDALTACEESLRIQPNNADAHNNHGNVLTTLGRPDEALSAYDEAVRIRPEFAAAHSNRGGVLNSLERPIEALAAYDEALRRNPSLATAHNNRGGVLKQLGRTDDASAAFGEALRVDPNHTCARYNRGLIFQEQGRIRDAMAAYVETLRIDPGFVEAHNNRGIVFKNQGRFDRSLEAFRQAMRVMPDFAEAQSNYLFTLNYDPAQDDDAVAAAHHEWGRRHNSPDRAFTTHANSPDPEKTLRVGLVSADLGRHPTGYFLDGVLAAIDPAKVRFICYDIRPREDDLAERLRSQAHTWRSSEGLSDEELAELIRTDEIDILVDLSGHTGSNRLTCFALKPAPVQVTWLGSCHTTGVPAIDYIVMDPVYVPDGGEGWFTETVVRLPDIRWCYSPPGYAPEVIDPPALRRGFVTFGSFNNLTKLNSGVVDLWARLLEAVPAARLLLSWKSLANDEERSRFAAYLAAHGIPLDRIDLTPGADSHAGVLGEYADVDIALDPFPFSGCLTTCEALWMGVPVVTLPMRRPVSRQTLGFLDVIGRTEWAARDAEDYIRIAAQLAGDAEHLTALRRGQRDRMAASSACDAPRFTRNLEAALRQMWYDWCRSRPFPTESES